MPSRTSVTSSDKRNDVIELYRNSNKIRRKIKTSKIAPVIRFADAVILLGTVLKFSMYVGNIAKL